MCQLIWSSWRELSVFFLAASKELLVGIGFEGFHQKILNLQHADDTLLFCKANKEYLTTLKLILYGFELAWGLKINFAKSYVYLLENNEDLQNQVACMLNCKVGKFPITCLKIPLRPNKLLHSDWKTVFDKVDKRLEGWKGSSLSRGAG